MISTLWSHQILILGSSDMLFSEVFCEIMNDNFVDFGMRELQVQKNCSVVCFRCHIVVARPCSIFLVGSNRCDTTKGLWTKTTDRRPEIPPKGWLQDKGTKVKARPGNGTILCRRNLLLSWKRRGGIRMNGKKCERLNCFCTCIYSFYHLFSSFDVRFAGDRKSGGRTMIRVIKYRNQK